MSTANVTVTKGHLAASGGLRGHSIGDTYPWSVVGIGYDGWQAHNLESGAVSGPVTDYGTAEDYAYLAHNYGLIGE